MSKNKDDKLTDQEMVEGMMAWLERGQLSDEDQELVDVLLAQEPDLQDERVFEEKLSDVLAEIGKDEAADAEETNDPAWLKFKARLETEEKGEAQPQLRPSNPRRRGEGRASVWRRFRLPQTSIGWLATAQTAAIAAMAVFLVPTQSPAPGDEYVTLSNADGTQLPVGNVILIPEPQASAAALSTLLQSAGARIVDGPMANGGYLIALDEEQLATGIEDLRASEYVLVVEGLDAGGQQ